MRRTILALAFALLTAAPGAAWSQTQGAQPDINRLREALKLSPAQERSWTEYLRAIEPSAQAQARHREAERLLPTLTTPRRMALIAATMQADEADFRKQSAAVNAFYAQLSAEQQRTFDAETRPPAAQSARN